MRHQKAGRRLSRSTDHRTALLRNLAMDLIRYEKITTTEAKAKELRRFVEKVITMGKGGTLASRRNALAIVPDEEAIDKVFSILAQRYQERPGGYSRIVKLGPRQGDGAPTARIELVP